MERYEMGLFQKEEWIVAAKGDNQIKEIEDYKILLNPYK